MAVVYVLVSADMQVRDGLSMYAQRYAIQAYCSMQGLRIIKIYQDIESGGKAARRGLAAALTVKADVVVVLKFDRVSRSLHHFCELYEEHFADGAKDLVAIRESIHRDSALGRALVSILMVFAQMEREATGERTREATSHIRRCGYHFGKTPYGFKTVPAGDNPRFRVMVEDEAEQKVLMRIKSMMEEGYGISKLAAILNQDGIMPPQGRKRSKSLLCNLKLRKGWHVCRPVNARNHSDQQEKVRVRKLRDRGTSYALPTNSRHRSEGLHLYAQHWADAAPTHAWPQGT